MTQYTCSAAGKITCKLIFQLGPVIKLNVVLLIVIKHHFAFVGVHHVTLNTMQGCELACVRVITSNVQRNMAILQLETLRNHTSIDGLVARKVGTLKLFMLSYAP